MVETAIDIPKTLDALPSRAKAPNSCRALDTWIAAAEREAGISGGGRMGWLVASTVVSAKLQQVLDESGRSRFMLKGGTLLQYRLGASFRATKDIDGVARGDLDSFIAEMDKALQEPWGTLMFSRTPVETVDVPEKQINPLRFYIILSIAGKTWRRVQVEICADEGVSGTPSEPVSPPSLAYFGLPTPDTLVGISMAYQYAQKLHGATMEHRPPEQPNERARDLVDLVLISRLIGLSGSPSLDEVAFAIGNVYESRAKEARILGLPGRAAPSSIESFPHWQKDFQRAAESAGLDLSLQEAVDEVNRFLSILPR